MIDWTDLGAVLDIPRQGARTIDLDGRRIAVFRTLDDRIFALDDRCPHKQGPLCQGIVHGHTVTCPLHNLRIALATGEAEGGDEGCTDTVAVRVAAGCILIARSVPLTKAA